MAIEAFPNLVIFLHSGSHVRVPHQSTEVIPVSLKGFSVGSTSCRLVASLLLQESSIRTPDVRSKISGYPRHSCLIVGNNLSGEEEKPLNLVLVLARLLLRIEESEVAEGGRMVGSHLQDSLVLLDRAGPQLLHVLLLLLLSQKLLVHVQHWRLPASNLHLLNSPPAHPPSLQLLEVVVACPLQDAREVVAGREVSRFQLDRFFIQKGSISTKSSPPQQPSSSPQAREVRRILL
mmetsp:Transcript_50069/g.156699  ORF Transcript_50069/g.156699 Transcript_50069/m.156699 type:complete len:234 (-) Transcript_50069:1702-2403(-)